MRNRTINIYVIVLLLLLVGCISHKETFDKVSSMGIELDDKVTEDKDIITDNLLVKTMNSGEVPEFMDIFRVDSSNPDSIVLYAHILDINRQMVREFFLKSGYKICSFTDNGRKITEYKIEERKEETLPFNISFVLDHSGSIGEQRATNIQQAVLNILDNKLDKDYFSIIKFSKSIEETVKSSNNKAQIRSQFPINGLAGFGQTTSLYDGIISGLNTLSGESSGRAIIVITDGYDNASERSLNDMLSRAVEEGINIYTVGFGDNIDEKILEYTSQRTGGKFYHIYKTEEFAEVFSDIYYRINSYYAIKYKVINKGRHEVVISLCKEDKAIEDTIIFYNDEIEDCDMIMSIETRGVLPDKTEVYEPEITIWERASREHHPLIPSVLRRYQAHQSAGRQFCGGVY